jgi:phytol kinase
MLALAWGDGMAAVVGSQYGKHKYRVFGETRSLEGSGAMLLFSFLTIGAALWVMGGMSIGVVLVNAFLLALAGTVIEALSYRDLDNLLVPFGVTGVFYLLF